MTWLYAAQFTLPLILIGWVVWGPARSGLGFVVRPWDRLELACAVGAGANVLSFGRFQNADGFAAALA